jgi:hypothetical protein
VRKQPVRREADPTQHGRESLEMMEVMQESSTAVAPQHLIALQRANRVRLARADLKRRIAEGEREVAEVILSSPWEAQSMTLADLLMSQRRWGATRCRKFLASLQIPEQKKVGTLTDRPRNALAMRLAPTRRLVLV